VEVKIIPAVESLGEDEQTFEGSLKWSPEDKDITKIICCIQTKTKKILWFLRILVAPNLAASDSRQTMLLHSLLEPNGARRVFGRRHILRSNTEQNKSGDEKKGKTGDFWGGWP